MYNIMARRVSEDYWDFGNQDVGRIFPMKTRTLDAATARPRRGKWSPGVVMWPGQEVLEDWASDAYECMVSGYDPTGGWGPARSCRVRWMLSKTEFNYKAADNDQYDLCLVDSCRTCQIDADRLEDRVDQYVHILANLAKLHVEFEEAFHLLAQFEVKCFNRVMAKSGRNDRAQKQCRIPGLRCT